jgi:N4-gp56 family major capsid protein
MLQLFAGDTVVNKTTDTTATTGNDLSAEMKTFYDMTLIDEAQANLVHDQFGQKRPIPKNGGKIIEFRKFAPLAKALTPLTEGVTPNGNKLDVSTITAQISQYGDFITQSDILELTALDNTILEATKLLGRQAGLTLDTVTRNVLQASTNVSFASKWSGTTETAVTQRSDLNATAVLKVDTVNQVVAKLRSINAPTINGKYVAIIHPFVAYDLMRDPEWIDAHKYAQPTNLYEGEIGEIGGVRFVQTSEAKIFREAGSNPCPLINSEGSTTDVANRLAVFSTLFLGAGAYGITEITGGGLQTIVKQKGSAGTADPLDQRSSVGWKAIKTAELLIPDYLVRVESCSSRFSAPASTAAN